LGFAIVIRKSRLPIAIATPIPIPIPIVSIKVAAIFMRHRVCHGRMPDCSENKNATDYFDLESVNFVLFTANERQWTQIYKTRCPKKNTMDDLP
jgi:hypothetical protein